MLDLEILKSFKLTRTLSENTTTGSIFLLGTIEEKDAILHLQKTVVPTEGIVSLIESGLEKLNVFLENEPYFSAHAWNTRGEEAAADWTIKVICPATETHIKKYEIQERAVVKETPELYERVVLPYIASFPEERLDWVYQILQGQKEVERVLYKDDHPENGFVVLPDLKWDQSSMNALYLTVIVQTKSIKCLRDLTTDHLPLLKDIQVQVYKVALEKFGVLASKLRLFVHYHPSYYHFHVHVVHIQHENLAGMMVGQAHLLDDLISLLELSDPAPAQSILAKMTYTYVLGVKHGLYAGLSAIDDGPPLKRSKLE